MLSSTATVLAHWGNIQYVRHVAPFECIIHTPNQPVLVLIAACMLNREIANVSFIVFDVNQPRLEKNKNK